MSADIELEALLKRSTAESEITHHIEVIDDALEKIKLALWPGYLGDGKWENERMNR